MILHEAKNEQEGFEYLQEEMLALTPVNSGELFSGAGSEFSMVDGGAFPMPFYAFGDSYEGDDEDMEEDNFDDMEEEDFEDEEDDFDTDEEDDEDEDFDEDDEDDYDYEDDDDDDFEYDEE